MTAYRKKNIITLMLLGLFFVTVKADCEIPTADDCDEGLETSFVADPYDCHSFYICSSTGNSTTISPYSYTCAHGSYFNGETCVPEDEDTPCQDECVIRYKCEAAECVPGTLSIYPDDYDCSKYYVCDLEGNSIPDECDEETPYFNGKECGTDESQCCTTTKCQPYCGNNALPLANVPDPCDCASFYLCQTENSIPSVSATCPKGQYFDADSGACSDSVECNQICTANQCDGTILPTTRRFTIGLDTTSPITI